MATVNLFEPALRADPYEAYEEIRAEGPVTKHELFGMWLVTGYDEATEVLNSPDRFSSATSFGADPFGAPVMLFSDPPDHTRLRGTVARAFTPRSIAALGPRIDDIAAGLVASCGPGHPWDVVAGLSYPLPVIVIAEMLGVAAEDRDDFKHWSDDLVATNDPSDPSAAERGQRAAQSLREYFAGVVADRRGTPGTDLVSRLIAANTDGSIDDAELLAACMLLLVAGNETTTNLISNTVLALGRRPDLFDRVHADLESVPLLLEEILRWDPPVHATLRLTTVDTTLGGVQVAANEAVLVLVAAANRDPRRFDAAGELAPERPLPGHLAFGHGIHHCLGASLARLEARAAITALLAGGRTWRLAEPAAVPPYGPSFFLRGITSLPIVAQAGAAAADAES